MKKLKPGVYSHLVSGDIALVEYGEDYGIDTVYADYIYYGGYLEDRTEGFRTYFGTLAEQPEIWQWIGEL